jgi:hypothetical protein
VTPVISDQINSGGDKDPTLTLNPQSKPKKPVISRVGLLKFQKPAEQNMV